jgi:hypothetical protein
MFGDEITTPFPDLTPRKGRDMLREIFAMKFIRHYPFVAAFFIAGRVFGAGDATVGAPPAAAATTMPAGAPELVDGYLKVGFDRLGAFPFVGDCSTVSASATEAQIPAAIKKLSGQKVIVTGFMLPVKMGSNDELATEFLLLKSQLLCCYGIAPQANEWVLVEMPKGVKPQMDVPISFRGTLHVGAMFENGYLTGIYSLDGE